MKLSVIIPIYNVERYLAQCLESVIYQTHQDLEIICIDDGSLDGSSCIYEKYAATDQRIKIIKQNNSGLSIARNVGLEVATGDYVHFLDSDDYIDLSYYEEMLAAASDTDADMAVGGVVSRRSRFNLSFETKRLLINIREKFEATNIFHSATVWKFIFKRSFLLLNNFCFPPHRLFEDILCIYETMLVANRIVTVPHINYYYVINDSSLTNLKSKDYEEQWKYAKQYRLSFIKKHSLEYLVPFKPSDTYIYKFLFIKLIKHKGIATRWYLFGLRILKITEQKEKIFDLDA